MVEKVERNVEKLKSLCRFLESFCKNHTVCNNCPFSTEDYGCQLRDVVDDVIFTEFLFSVSDDLDILLHRPFTFIHEECKSHENCNNCPIRSDCNTNENGIPEHWKESESNEME